jgi:F0F1-type ATP synthase membrane subunit b/b'
MLERARREINNARDSALRDIYQQSAELAMHMAGEVLKRQVSPEDHEKLLHDALEQWRNDQVSSN